jgi:transcriptional regulator with XRE-family HTH domain
VSDGYLMPVQCKMGRAALGWGVADLAKKAGVGINTVSRFENGSDAHVGTQRLLRSALEAGGVEFIAENGGGAGVRLKNRRG